MNATLRPLNLRALRAFVVKKHQPAPAVIRTGQRRGRKRDREGEVPPEWWTRLSLDDREKRHFGHTRADEGFWGCRSTSCSPSNRSTRIHRGRYPVEQVPCRGHAQPTLQDIPATP
jgi:hypothetical protein